LTFEGARRGVAPSLFPFPLTPNPWAVTGKIIGLPPEPFGESPAGKGVSPWSIGVSPYSIDVFPWSIGVSPLYKVETPIYNGRPSIG
jgi:hypothetical protein